jgi:hypothetical protein
MTSTDPAPEATPLLSTKLRPPRRRRTPRRPTSAQSRRTLRAARTAAFREWGCSPPQSTLRPRRGRAETHETLGESQQ